MVYFKQELLLRILKTSTASIKKFFRRWKHTFDEWLFEKVCESIKITTIILPKNEVEQYSPISTCTQGEK